MSNNKQSQEMTGSELLLHKMPLYARARRQCEMHSDDDKAECNTLIYRADKYPLLHLIRCCNRVIDGYSIDECFENDAFTGIQRTKYLSQRKWQSPSFIKTTGQTHESHSTSSGNDNNTIKSQNIRRNAENRLLRAMMSSSAVTECVMSSPQVDLAESDDVAPSITYATSGHDKITNDYAIQNKRLSAHHINKVQIKRNRHGNEIKSEDTAEQVWFSPIESSSATNPSSHSSPYLRHSHDKIEKEQEQESAQELDSGNNECSLIMYKNNLKHYLQSTPEMQRFLDSIRTNVTVSTHIVNATEHVGKSNDIVPVIPSSTMGALISCEKESNGTSTKSDSCVIYKTSHQVQSYMPSTSVSSWAANLWDILHTSYTSQNIVDANKFQVAHQAESVSLHAGSSSPLFMLDDSSGVTAHDRAQVATYLKRVKWIMQQQQQQQHQQYESDGKISAHLSKNDNESGNRIYLSERQSKSWHELTEAERVQREMEHTLAERKRFRRERRHSQDDIIINNKHNITTNNDSDDNGNIDEEGYIE